MWLLATAHTRKPKAFSHAAPMADCFNTNDPSNVLASPPLSQHRLSPLRLLTLFLNAALAPTGRPAYLWAQ